MPIPRSQAITRWKHGLTVGALTAGLTMAMLSGTSYLGTRCQCRYTPVLFAERAGMQRVVLPADVAPAERAAFARGAEAIGALADPDWKLGVAAGPPVVYVDDARRRALIDFAARWAATRSKVRRADDRRM